MPYSINRDGHLWDVVVSRKRPVADDNLVWLVRYDRDTKQEHRKLLCQLWNRDRFGWTVVVSGDVKGLRLVNGFRQRWQAFEYAIDVRTDLGKRKDED